MLNFYRRFLSDIAKTSAPINEFLQENIRGKTPILWSTKAEETFEKSKQSLAKATFLVHPKMNEELALFTDAFNQSIGVVVQQRRNNCWEPLAFFSKKLNKAETKYSAFDRELLAIYLAIKHFRHMRSKNIRNIYRSQIIDIRFQTKTRKKFTSNFVIWIS